MSMHVSQEFIDENKKLCQTMPKSRRGGPHPKYEREIIRNEVYRLHFDYGYSARKISELMKISRSTIKVDINYWYSKIKLNTNPLNPRYGIIATLERLSLQRTRLREQIDKTTDISEKIATERLLFDVDSKMGYIFQRMVESKINVNALTTKLMNNWLKRQKVNDRAVSYLDVFKVSKTGEEKIRRIIKEDKSRKYQ
jgi:translation initiation factor 2 beta subunit (eIF-2beta)/eIF-5